jgi:hypothetical protein
MRKLLLYAIVMACSVAVTVFGQEASRDKKLIEGLGRTRYEVHPGKHPANGRTAV